MDIEGTLKRSVICLNLRGETKEAIIAELVDMLVDAGLVQDREAALQAVMARESTMSTGMQHGVAIPHGKTEAVDELATAFGFKKEGVDFDSADGEPSRIFIMSVSSVTMAGPHMKFLAHVGRFLDSPKTRERVLAAHSKEEVLSLLSDR